jgi:hypothetical protein
MSANGNDLSIEFVIGAAAAASLVVGILSAAAAFIDEDDANGMRDKATAVACEVIADNLLKDRTKREQIGELTLDKVVAVKRRFVYWDGKRARERIAQDYLGVQPTFGPDDFKRIFREFLRPTMMRNIIICVVYKPFSRMATRSPTDKRLALLERS